MSQAAPAGHTFFSISACSQCHKHIPQSGARDSRHALPCAHIFCGACVAKVATEQKARKKPACLSAGCGKELAPAGEFVTAWCTQREGRVQSALSNLFADQGNAGDAVVNVDDEDEGESEREKKSAPKARCSKHRQPITALDGASKKPLCAKCIAAAGDTIKVTPLAEAIASEASKQPRAATAASKELVVLFDQFTFTPAAFRDGVAKWGAQETARIIAWEEQEVKAIQAVAAESTALVREVCARRLEVGGSILTQRYGLRATLEEIEYELSSLPINGAERLSRMKMLSAERERLTGLLSTRGITLADARAVSAWINAPDLAPQFGPHDEKKKTASPVEELGAAARETLSKLRDSAPGQGAGSDLPMLPSFSAAKHPLSIDLPSRPSRFTALNDSTVVIGYGDYLPLQVWDVNTGTKLRETKDTGGYVSELVTIDEEKVIVAWRPNARYLVNVYDMKKCKRLQTLVGIDGFGTRLGFAEGRMFAGYKGLSVWEPEPVKGHYVRKAFYSNSSGYCREITPLDRTIVALHYDNGWGSAQSIELWDWKAGRLLHVLTDLDLADPSKSSLFAISQFSRGLIITASRSGAIRFGSVDNWANSTLIKHSAEVTGILGGEDDEFVTTDVAGDVTFWRGGVRVGAVAGCDTESYGRAMARVGGKFVARGVDAKLLVFG